MDFKAEDYEGRFNRIISVELLEKNCSLYFCIKVIFFKNKNPFSSNSELNSFNRQFSFNFYPEFY